MEGHWRVADPDVAELLSRVNSSQEFKQNVRNYESANRNSKKTRFRELMMANMQVTDNTCTNTYFEVVY